MGSPQSHHPRAPRWLMGSSVESVVLDTSVVSILFNKDRDVRYPYYRKLLADRPCLISFQTMEELLYWRIAGSWGAARTMRLRDHITQYHSVRDRLAQRCACPHLRTPAQRTQADGSNARRRGRVDRRDSADAPVPTCVRRPRLSGNSRPHPNPAPLTASARLARGGWQVYGSAWSSSPSPSTRLSIRPMPPISAATAITTGGSTVATGSRVRAWRTSA